jgi:hypothetical protein
MTFELEAIDRLYLTVAADGRGVRALLKTQLGVPVPSTVIIAPISQRCVDAMDDTRGREWRGRARVTRSCCA